ncbi:hypothetical protein SAMD00023353_1400980 [Rosellinia necatrix]|uniref:Uncharacterized protein n=1 Tax=Rosellinia necatrix TaxID=77044 RepID=A0A1S8A6X9_ROSNE|nr:hypothetical protein SAMD00023353_1400980 [Rosellinia necatrix]
MDYKVLFFTKLVLEYIDTCIDGRAQGSFGRAGISATEKRVQEKLFRHLDATTVASAVDPRRLLGRTSIERSEALRETLPSRTPLQKPRLNLPGDRRDASTDPTRAWSRASLDN